MCQLGVSKWKRFFFFQIINIKWVKKRLTLISYFLSNFIYIVDCCLIGTWFNSIFDLATMMRRSQNFIGFYNINFSWYYNTWFNSQTWFTNAIFLSHRKFLPDSKTSIYNLIKFMTILVIIIQPTFKSIKHYVNSIEKWTSVVICAQNYLNQNWFLTIVIFLESLKSLNILCVKKFDEYIKRGLSEAISVNLLLCC